MGKYPHGRPLTFIRCVDRIGVFQARKQHSKPARCRRQLAQYYLDLVSICQLAPPMPFQSYLPTSLSSRRKASRSDDSIAVLLPVSEPHHAIPGITATARPLRSVENPRAAIRLALLSPSPNPKSVASSP